jgi:Fe-S cluster biogenesis protein NfuA
MSFYNDFKQKQVSIYVIQDGQTIVIIQLSGKCKKCDIIV